MGKRVSFRVSTSGIKSVIPLYSFHIRLSKLELSHRFTNQNEKNEQRWEPIIKKVRRRERMILVGMEGSKRKSTVAIINVMGEILQTPFDIEHSQNVIENLLELIKDYPKEQARFMMVATGIYHLGLVNELQK